MANVLQRFIYHFSNAVPLMLMTALVWFTQNNNIFIPIILISVSIVVTILFFGCFSYAKKHCAVKNINITSIASKDSWLIAYVVAYLLPFTYMVISDFHIVSVSVVVMLLLLVLIPGIFALPNFLLFFAGYHFYEVSTDETGINDYLLVSKKNRIRNKTEIKNVVRVFEKLLIDA